MSLHFSLLIVTLLFVKRYVLGYPKTLVDTCMFRDPNTLSFSAVSMCSCKWEQGILFECHELLISLRMTSIQPKKSS